MKLIERLVARGDRHRGRELLDDVHELFEERRAARGWLYASGRRLWDVLALIVRRRAPRPQISDGPHGNLRRLYMDVRAAARAVRGRPIISLSVIASLALGLGLTMLTFTVVDGILLRPLPFPRSQELLSIYSDFRPESGYTYNRFALSGPEIADFAAQMQSVDVAAYQPQGVALADGVNDVERVPAVRVSAQVFRLLETPPLIGRTLTAADDRPGAACTAVLSHGLWRERFALDAGVVGRTVRIGGAPCEIVGVMPPRFAFPTETARLWLPLTYSINPDTRGDHGLIAIGRLKPDVPLMRAQDERSALMARWERDIAHHKGHAVVMAPLRDDLVARVEQQLLVLGGAVVLVLLTIAANMSSLLLAHGDARRREMAVRGALGASRASLVRQMLIEGWLLAAVGGLAGGIAAWLSVESIVAAYPAALPRASEVTFDLRTVIAGLVTSLAIGTLVSAAPALRFTRVAADALRSGDRGTAPPALRAQRLLVISEVAIGVAVSVGALLLVQTFVRLQRVPLGFDSAGVTTALVGLPGGAARGPDRTRQFYTDLRSRLSAVPGVIEVGAISSLPMVSNPPPDNFTIEGRPVARPSEPGFNAGYVMVTPRLFEALGMTIVRGRAIEESDTAGAPAVAVINETLARLYWRDVDPIGRRIRYPEGVQDGEWSEWGPWISIVGIVGDIHEMSPAQPPRPAIYVAHAQLPRSFYDGRTMGVVVRSQGTTATAALRRVVRELDADASVSTVRTMDALAGAAIAQPRFMGWIMTIFACVALAVAAVGVYGVVSYRVALRRREIGVRLALGASRGSIAQLIARQTAGMAAVGVAIGLIVAVLLAGWMRTLLFEVDPYSVPVYGTVIVVLAAATALATLVPARRATRVDPATALKTDL